MTSVLEQDNQDNDTRCFVLMGSDNYKLLRLPLRILSTRPQSGFPKKTPSMVRSVPKNQSPKSLLPVVECLRLRIPHIDGIKCYAVPDYINDQLGVVIEEINVY